MNKIIDLRSDTVTHPTQAMRDAMQNAALGDDVYGDDPTVNELERRAAEVVGKEAALFVPTGTFGNQLALFAHCERGDEVILGEDCHIVAHEAGGAAVIAGVQLRAIPFCGGMPSADEIRKRIRKSDDYHEPRTGLICLENALANGRAVPLEIMRECYETANEHGIPVHLDGARMFNAAESLGVPASGIAAYTDSLMFCLSKGLCAPAGSILAGNAAFIGGARRKRKLMGGGMRQAGVLAAPGLLALDVMTKRLGEDHSNAKLLGKLLSEIKGVTIAGGIDINMIFFNIDGTSYPKDEMQAELRKRGIVTNGHEHGIFRLVTHHGITEADARHTAGVIKDILS
ncbi:MAG: low-specificity L-threonine aldolase [Defluviitaleaceae bacterium]|nr:low-specificity L-threonine aldolase [Defluviitaleaceae bacterium]MCL2836264.1 low-specificity L-threonine aldolase [Defluviitaleaceae bacterium]